MTACSWWEITTAVGFVPTMIARSGTRALP